MTTTPDPALTKSLSSLFTNIMDGASEMIKRLPAITITTTTTAPDIFAPQKDDPQDQEDNPSDSAATSKPPPATTIDPKLTRGIISGVMNGIAKTVMGTTFSVTEKPRLSFTDYISRQQPKPAKLQKKSTFTSLFNQFSNKFWNFPIATTTPAPPPLGNFFGGNSMESQDKPSSNQDADFKLPVVSDVIEDLTSKISDWTKGIRRQGFAKPTGNNKIGGVMQHTALTMSTPRKYYFTNQQPKANSASAERFHYTNQQPASSAESNFFYTNSDLSVQKRRTPSTPMTRVAMTTPSKFYYTNQDVRRLKTIGRWGADRKNELINEQQTVPVRFSFSFPDFYVENYLLNRSLRTIILRINRHRIFTELDMEQQPWLGSAICSFPVPHSASGIVQVTGEIHSGIKLRNFPIRHDQGVHG